MYFSGGLKGRFHCIGHCVLGYEQRHLMDHKLTWAVVREGFLTPCDGDLGHSTPR